MRTPARPSACRICAAARSSLSTPKPAGSISGLGRVVSFLAAAFAAVFLAQAAAAARPQLAEVVITLDAPPLARAIAESRVLTARAKARRLDVRSPTSVSYVRSLTAAQRTLVSRIVARIPSARIGWRYRVVLNGISVLVPRDRLPRLSAVPGVARVWPSVAYRPLLDRSPTLIGADRLWSAPQFTTAGNGIKIGIIDDGVDQKHPFLNPKGFTMPPGFPKGNVAYTTAKVIVARAFSPRTNTWKYGTAPFDPEQSEHGTHVAGIAAGNYTPGAIPGRGPLSGVAPNAYLGNYKVLTVPTESFGLNGNSPEIAAGIEAAVRDGMDVINLSLGEPEIEPSRDLVVAAIDAAAQAGVVPTIAAGNDFQDYGNGSVSSPGSAPLAITAAAASKRAIVASFSSGGPTPLSLQLKPDVSAPGVDITSSVPARNGGWSSFSGTSMAAPHVAGAAALLRQRHPDWTVAQLKSALVLTGRPVELAPGAGEAPTTREGGGLIDLAAANDPRLFAAPTDLSFGLLRTGTSKSRQVELGDAGGGAGTWNVSVIPQEAPVGVTVTVPATVAVPGRLGVTVTAAPESPQVDATGFILLRLGDVTRRIPYWFRVTTPRLDAKAHGTLARNGLYRGQTRGMSSLVTSYRYPANPSGTGVSNTLRGPEQVFRVTLTKPVANFGVAVVGQDPGVRVTPRIVAGGDENRLTGNPSLPLVINPYLDSFGRPRPISAAIRPAPGIYNVVFDTRADALAGEFTFRFWINDRTPPRVRLTQRTVTRGSSLVLAVTDLGSGVDPESLEATVDGRLRDVTFSAERSRAAISTLGIRRGVHRLVLRVSDYQETKNMENVPQILPNTRVFRASFRVA